MERIKDYKKLKDECINWIRNWFEENGKGCNAVIGISGGKDSTIVAKLCVEALGADRVIGVSLPGEGQDNEDAIEVAEALGIELRTIHLGDLLKETMGVAWFCNASENYIGYFTKWGDGASDCEPIGNLTVHEVKRLGYELQIPRHLVDKTPDDGLPNSKPDEEKFGFSYDMIDKYICGDYESIPEWIQEKIEKMHDGSLFKTKVTMMIDSFMPNDILEFEYGSLDSYQEFMDNIDNNFDNWMVENPPF